MIRDRAHFARLLPLAIVAAFLQTACNATSPLSPTERAPLDRLELQFGDLFGSGAAVELLNGTPTFYSAPGGFRVSVYAIDRDGVYESVTGRTTLSSSNTALATVNAALSSVTLPGGSGSVVLTATYSGKASSLAFTVTTAQRPRSVSASIIGTTPGDPVIYRVFIPSPDGFGNISIDQGQVRWTSSNPAVIAVSGSTLEAVAPGTSDLTIQFGGQQTTYRVAVPPFPRLTFLP